MDQEQSEKKDEEVTELYRTMMARAKYAGIDYKPGDDTTTTAGKLKVIEELKLYVGD